MGPLEILRETKHDTIWGPIFRVMAAHMVTAVVATGFMFYFLVTGDMIVAVELLVPILFSLLGWWWISRAYRKRLDRGK